MIDGQNPFNQPLRNNWRTEKILKGATVQWDGYSLFTQLSVLQRKS